MLQGWPALVTLWTLVVLSWVGWVYVIGTPWRDSPVGQFLFGLLSAWTVWWSLILLGSYAAAYWTWLQVAQFVALVAVTLTVAWLDVLMVRARHGSLWPGRGRRRRDVPVNHAPTHSEGRHQ